MQFARLPQFPQQLAAGAPEKELEQAVTGQLVPQEDFSANTLS